jgi:hypothetical protein
VEEKPAGLVGGCGRSAQATANERAWRCLDRRLLLQHISPPLTFSPGAGENAVSDRPNRGCSEEDQPGNRGEQRVGHPPSFWAGDPDRTLVSRNRALCLFCDAMPSAWRG